MPKPKQGEQEMKYWNYRIVNHEDEERGLAEWTVRVVVYDEHNEVVAISKAAVGALRDSRDGVLEEVDRITQATFDQPLLWERDLLDGIEGGSIEVVNNTRTHREKLPWSDGKDEE
jgi:NADPH-dependent 2,4-dienoyl-CoA reductase/sulfur reductase-like enzyme